MLQRVSCTHTWKANSTKNHGSQSAPDQQVPHTSKRKDVLTLCLIQTISHRTEPPSWSKWKTEWRQPTKLSPAVLHSSAFQQSSHHAEHSPKFQISSHTFILTFKADVNTLGGILWSYYYEIKYTQTLLVGRQTTKWQLQHSVCLKQQARQKEIIH